jgi:UDP-3-O-acyl-N-acetylglucosamine deacetylase
MMARSRQRTVRAECSYTGIGIHTGREVTVRFKPAPPHSGVVFVRVDLPGSPPIPASIGHVEMSEDYTRRTTLASQGVRIYTVEHVLAALAGLGLDNVTVELNSDEPAEPTDGSCMRRDRGTGRPAPAPRDRRTGHVRRGRGSHRGLAP